MSELLTQRRALGGRADLLARTAGRPLTRDDRRLLASYDRAIPSTRSALETRAHDQSVAIQVWCAKRTNPKVPMTTDERADYVALAAEHRSTSDRITALARTAAPAPIDPTRTRQRLAALAGI